ncbi:hypothetical protein Golob_027810, partial [Gossypium lobatum]|nr:hypothetical protein [Gossypium lobatum]
MYKPASHEGSQVGLSGNSSFYNPHHRMGFKHRRYWWCKHLHVHYSIKMAHRPNTDNQMLYRRNQNPNRNNHNPTGSWT